MKKLISFLFVLLTCFMSCEPPIVFNEPQPRGVIPRSTFERQYLGNYYCDSDTSLVVVMENGLYKEKAYGFLTTTEAIEEMEDVQLKNGKLYVDLLDEPIEVTYVDENVWMGELMLRDTLFWIDDDHVLKYFKGHQILNTRLNNERWDIHLVSHDEYGNLLLSTTKLPEDLEKLEAITPVTDISTEDKKQYLLSPTKKEFRKLLKTKLIFEECDYFERVGGTSVM